MASQAEPPPFQEAARCDVCKSGFNTFRRRHHCRCCGRTLCSEHSSNHMALPQFGIFSDVRVCADCFNNVSRAQRVDSSASFTDVGATANKISKLDLGQNSLKQDLGLNNDGNAELDAGNATKEAPECKCGMPLCICEAPILDPIPVQVEKPTVIVQSNPRPRRNIGSQRVADSNSTNMAASSSIKQSLFFNAGQSSSERIEKTPTNYESNGEGLREAIKNDDVSAVKKLLSEGVDANYCDKQGLTLLHLAAVFNRTEIAFILMDHGASPERKNAQGETPLECAPTMLQHKMRKKLEEGR